MRFRNVVLPLVAVLCPAVINAQDKEKQSELLRWEIGGHYTLLNIPSNRVGCGGCRVNNSGFGAHVGYNFTRFFAFDAEVNFFPDPGQGASNLDGGRITQGLFGARLGRKIGRWSFFGKGRPGFVSFGRAIVGVQPGPPLSFRFGRITHLALNYGGILEYRLTPQSALRLDLGDTVVRYGAQGGAVYQHNFQMRSGIVFRF